MRFRYIRVLFVHRGCWETPGMSDPAPPSSVSIAETAQILGRSEAYVLELLASGVLPQGEDGRVPLDDLERYLARRAPRRRGLRDIASLVDESPGGWEQ